MSYAAEYADFPMPIMMIAYADNDDYIMVMTSCDYDVLRWWFLTMICYDNEFKLWWWLWFLLWWFPMTMSYKFGIWFLMTSQKMLSCGFPWLPTGCSADDDSHDSPWWVPRIADDDEDVVPSLARMIMCSYYLSCWWWVLWLLWWYWWWFRMICDADGDDVLWFAMLTMTSYEFLCWFLMNPMTINSNDDDEVIGRWFPMTAYAVIWWFPIISYDDDDFLWIWFRMIWIWWW